MIWNLKSGSKVWERDLLREEGREENESFVDRGSEREKDERKESRPGGGEVEIRVRV